MLKQIYGDAIGVLFSPKKYFESLAQPQSLKYPLLRAVVYILFFGLLLFISSIPTAVTLSAKLGSFIDNFIRAPVIGVIAVLGSGVFVMLISLILGGSTEYKQAVNVISSLLIASVSSVVLLMPSLFPGPPNIVVIIVLSVPVSIYFLWLTYNAYVYGLKAKPGRTLILIALLSLVNIMGIVAMSFIPVMLRQAMYKGGLQQDNYTITLGTSVPAGSMDMDYDEDFSTTTVDTGWE